MDATPLWWTISWPPPNLVNPVQNLPEQGNDLISEDRLRFFGGVQFALDVRQMRQEFVLFFPVHKRSTEINLGVNDDRQE